MSDPAVFTVAKADAVGKEETPGAVLHITGELRKVGETLPRLDWCASHIYIHAANAAQVCAALAHLPQGTVDQVLVLLLQQRASLVRVPGPWPLPAEAWSEVPAALIRAVREVFSEGIDPEEAAAALWESLRPRATEEGS